MRQAAWWSRLAPEPGRTFPGERAWSIALRTIHLAGFGLVFGGYVWGVAPERLAPALVLTIASGTGLAGIELYKSAHWLFLGKGLAVALKLLLLAAVPVAGEGAVPLLIAVVVIASVGSHAPSRFRHYSVLLGRPLEASPRLLSLVDRARPRRRAAHSRPDAAAERLR